MRVASYDALIARKKPRSPSRIRVAPVKPARARSAASTPLNAALPGCRCLLIAPSALNSHSPAACVPARAERVEHLRRRRVRAATPRRPRRRTSRPFRSDARSDSGSDSPPRRCAARRRSRASTASRNVAPGRVLALGDGERRRESPAPPRAASSLCGRRRARGCATRRRWRAPRRRPTSVRPRRRSPRPTSPNRATTRCAIRAGGSSAPASAEPSQSRIARCASTTTCDGRSSYVVDGENFGELARGGHVSES